MTMVHRKCGYNYYLLSYEHFYLPKLALQNGLEKVLFTATFGMPLRAKGDCDVTESYLEWRS